MHKSPEVRRAYIRKYQQEHRDAYNARLQIAREKRRSWAVESLGGKCIRCGATADLQFDHIDPLSKVLPIGKMLNARAEVFLAELQKCQLLCEPCHRDKTREPGGMKHQAQHGTSGMYNGHRCRCDACRLWKREYDIAWKRRHLG